MIYYTIEPKTLEHLQSFPTVEAMDDHVKRVKQSPLLSKTDRAILDAIRYHASSYPGVCHINKQKIAERAGFISRRTTIRACNHMARLGILKQYETRKIVGDRRREANIMVIQAGWEVL